MQAGAARRPGRKGFISMNPRRCAAIIAGRIESRICLGVRGDFGWCGTLRTLTPTPGSRPGRALSRFAVEGVSGGARQRLVDGGEELGLGERLANGRGGAQVGGDLQVVEDAVLRPVDLQRRAARDG